ncbi:hypothetical protein FRB99_007533 [Tulasnella sp. 403]|nr:hypothetical protein FRB99_007533 [Tulasnella sp. 403]
MVLSGRTMIHGLPKRPVTTATPPPPRPTATTPSAGSSSRSQLHTLPTHHAHLPPTPPQPTFPTTNPPLANTSEVFLSQISLPERPVISYRQFGPVDGVRNPHLAVELVRRSLIQQWDHCGILDTYLTVVRADKHSVSLWVFVVGSETTGLGDPSSLETLHFDEMHAIRNGSFTPADLLPCSPECKHPTKACPQCSAERPSIQNDLPSSCLLPRSNLRVPYAAFLDAVRDRLIDKVSQQQHARSYKDSQTSIMKLTNGFILGHQDSGSAWGSSWESDSQRKANKSIYCYLHLSLLSTRLLIQPLFNKIPLLSLPMEVSPGAPIVMLPYGTPAHYIGPYVGPVREHKDTFKESLKGLGCRDWDDDGFVVCWITIRNPNGPQQPPSGMIPPPWNPSTSIEERGLMAVWPRSLCLLSTSPSRQPLTTFPTIPASVCPPVSPPRPTPTSAQKESPIPSSPILQSPTGNLGLGLGLLNPAFHDIASHTGTSFVNALKSLTIDGNAVKYGFGFDAIASEMSSYVDYVVKEREREKERVAKEKERQRKDGERVAVATTGLTGATSRLSNTRSGAQNIVSSGTGASSRLTVAAGAVLTQQRPQGSASNPQGYYPSPPEFNSPGTLLPDTARSGAEISPQVSQPHMSSANIEAPQPDSSETTPRQGPSEVEVIPAENPDLPDDNRMNVDVGSESGQLISNDLGHPELGSAFDIDITMGIGDVTEDDFNFFDADDAPNVPLALPPTTSAVVDPKPGATESLDASHELALPPDGLQHPHPEEVELKDPTKNPLDLHLDLQPNVVSHSIPLSPAQTLSPSSSPSAPPYSLPSPVSADLPPVTEAEPVVPPDYPYRIKEYVPHQFEAIPVPLSSILADMKYSIPGSKYCGISSYVSSPRLLSRELEPVPENSTAHVSNEFINAVTPSIPIVPVHVPLPLHGIAAQLLANRNPGNKDLAALEKQRAKRRADSRQLRERPARHGEFELWHSKKFIDRFATDTDPRVKHVKRLRGLKRNLEWTPYPYLRTEGDGDARSKWTNWGDFVDVIPDENAALLCEEETSEDDTDAPTPGFATEDETVVVAESETSENRVASPVDTPRKDEQAEKERASLAPGRTLRTPPPQLPTLVEPHGASLLQTHFHPNHIFPLASSQASRGLFRLLPNVIASTALKTIPEFSPSPSYATGLKPFKSITTPPLFSVGQSDTVLHLAAPSLRFWEKLGLKPLGGTKDVVAFALYDEEITTPEHISILSRWIHKVAGVYGDRGFGTHYVGSTQSQSPQSQIPPGLVPFKWDSIKKTLAGLIPTLPAEASHIVFYVVSTPTTALTTSKDFRQLSGVIANLQSAIAGLDGRISFQFVPRSLVYSSLVYPVGRHLGLERFVLSVYDRLLRKVYRTIPRPIFRRQSLRMSRFIESPSFTLARETPKFSFILVDWPPASADAADRHTLLHIAYQLSSAKDWLFISGIDERGEAHQMKVWFMGVSESEDEVYDKVVRRVMEFAMEFAAKANVEWNVVVARLGAMVESELIAWEKCLHRDVLSQDTPMHVTIACVEHNASLAVIPSNGNKSTPSSVAGMGVVQKGPFQDMSMSSYVLVPNHRIPLVPPNALWIGPDTLSTQYDPDTLVSTSSLYGSTPPPPQIGLLPLASAYIFHASSSGDYTVSPTPGSDHYSASTTSIQLHVLRTGGSLTSSFRKSLPLLVHEISKNYCSLAVLARERWGILTYGSIPFHLAAVDIMRGVLAYAREPAN